MIKKIIALSLVLVALPALSDVYRWKDENGNWKYSDRFHEGAEKITLKGLSTYKNKSQRRTSASEQEDTEGAIYQDFSIQRPLADQTIRANDGIVSVSLMLKPALRNGDKIGITLDGVAHPSRITTSQFSLSDVVRGSHSISATIYDEAGNSLASADAVTFHVQKVSVLKPN